MEQPPPEPLIINQRLAELAVWVVALKRLLLETLAWHRQVRSPQITTPR